MLPGYFLQGAANDIFTGFDHPEMPHSTAVDLHVHICTCLLHACSQCLDGPILGRTPTNIHSVHVCICTQDALKACKPQNFRLIKPMTDLKP